VLLAKANEVRDTSHRPIIIHDFADNPGALQSGETCQIDRGFRLTSSLENTSRSGAQWENVSRTGEVFCTAIRINCGPDRLCAIIRRYASRYSTT
jgi:hypothetical protein